MGKCVDINSKAFKDLTKGVKTNKHILAAKMGVWQTENETDELPNKTWLGKTVTAHNKGVRVAKKSEGVTSAMKIKIAFSDTYKPLLKAQHLDGEPIGSLDRLNDMLKNDEWLNIGDNRQMLTLIAVRIPVQGMNSMEFMEVYEFLKPEAGSIIITSSEIVTKSGADFDVDKMTVMMPNLTIHNGVAALQKTGVTKKTEETLIKERSVVNDEITAIKDKYKKIFKEHDVKGDFKFSQEEVQKLAEFDKEIKKLESKKEALKKTWVKEEADKALGNKQQVLNYYEEKINDIEVLIHAVDQSRSSYIKGFNTGIAWRINNEKSKELQKKYDELTEIKYKIQSLKKGAVENDLLASIKNILELKQNFVSLITPNSTDILYGKSQEMREYNAGYNPFTNKNKEHVLERDGKDAISPTRVLEVGYNAYKHKANSVGMETLGLGAIDNTYNVLFNRIGAHMNYESGSKTAYTDALKANAKKRTDEQKELIKLYKVQKILMPHNHFNYKGNEVISLAHTRTQSNEAGVSHAISDIINQMINGWVDIAADSWISNIQGNRELAPVLLFLIQAGVPIEQAIDFMSNPLIKEYLKEKQKSESMFATALNNDPDMFFNSKSQAIKNVIAKHLDLFDGVKDINFLHKGAVNTLANDTLTGMIPFTEKELSDAVKKTDTQLNKRDAAMFLHFTQLQDMSDAVRDVKLSTNVDTSRDMSLFDAHSRLDKLKNVNEGGALPANLPKQLEKESPISSFFIQEFMLDLFGILFPIRNHKYLNDYAKNNIGKTVADITFDGDVEKTVNTWKSDLVSYVFQNELRDFDTSRTHYRSRELFSYDVENVHLRAGATIKEGKLYVDMGTLKRQYANNAYSNYSVYSGQQKLATVQPGTFTSESEYVHFVLERETLRDTRPLEGLVTSKRFQGIMNALGEERKFKQNKDETDQEYYKRVAAEAYERYLRDTALTKIFNHKFLFKSTNTYAAQFVQLTTAFPGLKSFKLINTLDLEEGKGFKNLVLNDTKLTGDDINILHENLEYLITPSALRAVLPEATDQDIAEIVEFFEIFPIVAYLQSGMDAKSKFSLVSIVDQKDILSLLEPASKKLESLLNTPVAKGFLNNYTTLFKHNNASANRFDRIRGKDYYDESSVFKKPLVLKDNTLDRAAVYEERFINENNTFDISKLMLNEVKDAVETVQSKTFVYGGTMADTMPGKSGDAVMQGLKNTMGIPVKSNNRPGSKTGFAPHLIRDNADGTIKIEVKNAIDAAMTTLREEQNSGQTLIFNQEGYGNEMINKNIKSSGNKEFAPETFVYLSKELHKLGFVNPLYATSTSGAKYIQSFQTITDEEITKSKEIDDATIKDLMKYCILK